jgi:hypothetical protein
MKTPSFAALLVLAPAASAFALVVPGPALEPAAPASVRSAQTAAPRFEPACANVVFQPEDPPVSKPVTLNSQEWVTECVPVGTIGESCWERPGRLVSLAVRLSLPDRKRLLPWESDVFRACLAGSLLSVEPVSTAYDYAVVRDGALDGNVVLSAGAKRLLPPDPRGVQAVLTPGLTLAFSDLWQAYYPGGQVVLKIALKKEIRFWPDETVDEKEVTLPVSQNYYVELGGAVNAPGGFYYARYSIKRLGGQVSSEAETPVLQTEKVSYDRDLK